jgi:mono/diheme cytochrome c family protein
MPMASDGYLYWTIAEGGVSLKTAMPPFKGALKPDQIWQIILYLRQI